MRPLSKTRQIITLSFFGFLLVVFMLTFFTANKGPVTLQNKASGRMTSTPVPGIGGNACVSTGATCFQGLTGRTVGTCCVGSSCIVPRGIPDANGTCQTVVAPPATGAPIGRATFTPVVTKAPMPSTIPGGRVTNTPGPTQPAPVVEAEFLTIDNQTVSINREGSYVGAGCWATNTADARVDNKSDYIFGVTKFTSQLNVRPNFIWGSNCGVFINTAGAYRILGVTPVPAQPFVQSKTLVDSGTKQAGEGYGWNTTGWTTGTRRLKIVVQSVIPTLPSGGISTCRTTGAMCGGIANLKCCAGLTCQLSSRIADASGTCVIGDTIPIRNTVALTMKLRLQAVTRKPATGFDTANFAVVLSKNGVKQTQHANFTADANGVWTNTTPMTFTNITTGGGFAVFIKGPQHLQKKVCVQTPVEPKDSSGNPDLLKYVCGDTQNITLADGDNTLDFSGIYMPAGDLPIGGTQDAVSDSLDMSYLIANDQSHDSGVLRIGDLNRDGVINVIDRNLLRYVLSRQVEETR